MFYIKFLPFIDTKVVIDFYFANNFDKNLMIFDKYN